MERGHIVFVAVIVSALSLFGLKVWSDRTADSKLEAESRGAAERLARASGLHGGSDSWSQAASGSGGGSLRPGGPLRAGAPSGSGGGGATGRVAGGGPDGRGGGSAESVRAGGSSVGGGFGSSGSGRLPGGWGGAPGGVVNVPGGDSGSHAGPKPQQKQNLVDFLSSQPPTQANLALADTKPADGEGVALKIDKPEDISKQGGEEQNVQNADGGDGIKITDSSNIQFPNNVNPDAATISFKIEPQWSGGDQTDNALLELRGEHDWANRVELVKNGDFLRFIVTPSGGQEIDISARINDWQAGDQHDVQASYGNGQTSLVIDGRLVGTQQLPQGSSLQFAEGVPLLVGGDYPGSNYGRANATIRNLLITNSANHGG